ncbi:MAG: serine/threonine-protein kinase [Myxococcota bacterium]
MGGERDPAAERVDVDGFTLLSKLRDGPMGKVYEAEQRSLARRVALKILSSDGLQKRPWVQALRREGELLARFSHPNIVTVFERGTWEGRPYFVMEYLEGETLADRLAGGPMSPVALAALSLPILSAVAACHERGIVHGDLKPENVFLASIDTGIVPKLIDFGIAFDAGIAKGPEVSAGTPEYMAPEVLRGEPAGAGSDQYAMGVVLYEMATGHLPRLHEDDPERLRLIAKHGLVPPRHHVPNLDETLEEVIERALHPERSARFRDMREMMRALLPVAGPRERAEYKAQLDAADRNDDDDGLDSEESGSIPTLDARMVDGALDSIRPSAAKPPAPATAQTGFSWAVPLALVIGVAVGFGLGVLLS